MLIKRKYFKFCFQCFQPQFSVAPENSGSNLFSISVGLCELWNLKHSQAFRFMCRKAKQLQSAQKIKGTLWKCNKSEWGKTHVGFLDWYQGYEWCTCGCMCKVRCRVLWGGKQTKQSQQRLYRCEAERVRQITELQQILSPAPQICWWLQLSIVAKKTVMFATHLQTLIITQGLIQ